MDRFGLPWQEVHGFSSNTIHDSLQFVGPAPFQDQQHVQFNAPNPYDPHVGLDMPMSPQNHTSTFPCDMPSPVPLVRIFSIWPPMIQMQEASVAYVSSQCLAAVPSQDQVCRSNAPMCPQPVVQGFGIRQESVQAQGTSPLHAPPQFILLAPSQDQVPQLNVPTLHQSPSFESGVWQQMGQVRDPSPVHLPSQNFMPAPSQIQVPQRNAPTPARLLVCPKSKCNATFGRKQDRTRHFRSHLPYSIFCPFPRCPWRGRRQDIFKWHWEKKHLDHGQTPAQHQTLVYNPDSLLKSIDLDALTFESALEIALSIMRVRATELDRVDVWEGGWGRREVQM
ncbi:hypothetical protein BC826DRAFT_1015896 [Russula brevipes]|nr:hypothetical protein BC826DRAFT_1015896 [Russula brevipes]